MDGGDEIIACAAAVGARTFGGGGGENTERQDGQKDLVSHNKVLADLSSDTGILLRVLAAVVSKAMRTNGLELSRQALDKVSSSSGLF